MARWGEKAKSERRKAERRIKQLERDISKMTNETKIKSAKAAINTYRETIEQARMFKGGKKIQNRTAADFERAVKHLESMNKDFLVREMKNYFSYATRQSNSITKVNITGGIRGDVIDDYDEVSGRMFFRATQDLWEGTNPQSRYDTIMERLDVDNLEIIYLAFKDANNLAIRVINKMTNNEPLTREEKEFAKDIKAKDESQDKKYSSNFDSPLVGMIASSDYTKVTYDMIMKYIDRVKDNPNDENYDIVMDYYEKHKAEVDYYNR